MFQQVTEKVQAAGFLSLEIGLAEEVYCGEEGLFPFSSTALTARAEAAEPKQRPPALLGFPQLGPLRCCLAVRPDHIRDSSPFSPCAFLLLARKNRQRSLRSLLIVRAGWTPGHDLQAELARLVA